MTHLRSITLFALLLALSLPIAASAQPVAQKKSLPAVAFTKVDRSQLWIKRFDSAAYIVLQAHPSASNRTSFDTIRQLAVLDQTDDGQTLLLGGTFSFYSPWGDNKVVTWTGIISVPTDSLSDDAHLLSHIHFLKSFQFPQTTFFRPVGRVTSDRKWFALMGTKAPFYNAGLFKLYHGSLDTSFNEGGNTADPEVKIDSATPTQNTSSPNNWHCSNIAVTPNGKRAVVVATEQISADESQTFAMRIYGWDFDNGGFGVALYENTFANYKTLIRNNTLSPDTMFGFGVRIAQDGYNAEVALTPNEANSPVNYKSQLLLHQFNFYTFNGMTQTQTLPLPPSDSEWYFAGPIINGGYNEDNTNGAQHGNAGDLYFNHGASDTVVFITHPSHDRGEPAQRNKYSSICVGTVGGSAVTVYDDSSAQELQPVLVKVTGYEMHYPKLSASTQSIDFGKVDSGKSNLNTKTITLSSTESVAQNVIIDSIVLLNGTNFSLVGGTKTQTSASPSSPITLTPSFKPIDATAGVKRDTIKIYWSDSVKEVTTIALSGTENIPPPPPPKSVREEDPAVFAMSVQPNPFAQSARISLTAPDAGSIAIVVHDALGREVYASESMRTVAGEAHDFTFDAKSLGLPTGTYYVTALLGDRAATREMVFVK